MISDFNLYLFNSQHTQSAVGQLLTASELVTRLTSVDSHPASIVMYQLSTSDDLALKAWLYNTSQEHQFDYCLLPQARSLGPFKLAVFDMDSTLIPLEVIDELAALAGVGEQVAAITEAAMRGELDFNQSLEQRVRQLKGLPVTAIEEVKRTLEFNPGVEPFCRHFVAQGGQLAIVSGGFMPFAESLAKRLPFNQLRANRLKVAGEALTGEVEYPIVNADVKVTSLQSWASESGLSVQNCIAVGDGANDLKMLEQAGIGVAFRAKPTLGQAADCVLNVGYLDSLITLLPLIEQQHGSVARSHYQQNHN